MAQRPAHERSRVPPPVVPAAGQTLNYYAPAQRKSALKRLCNHVRYHYAGAVGGALAVIVFVLLYMTLAFLRVWAATHRNVP